jgi:hypothetical protein
MPDWHPAGVSARTSGGGYEPAPVDSCRREGAQRWWNGRLTRWDERLCAPPTWVI